MVCVFVCVCVRVCDKTYGAPFQRQLCRHKRQLWANYFIKAYSLLAKADCYDQD